MEPKQATVSLGKHSVMVHAKTDEELDSLCDQLEESYDHFNEGDADSPLFEDWLDGWRNSLEAGCDLWEL